MNITQRKQSEAAKVRVQSSSGEVWKDVKGYEGLYMVSNKQRIKKAGYWTQNGRGYLRFKKEKLIKYSIKKKYPSVALIKDGIKSHKLFHRLVCAAFHDNQDDKPEVNHIKGWAFGHTPENLEWSTKLANVQHAFSNGFMKPPKGKNHYAIKLSDKQIQDIRKLRLSNNYTHRQLAALYDVSQSHITNIINNRVR